MTPIDELMRYVLEAVSAMQGCKLSDLAPLVIMRAGGVMEHSLLLRAIEHLTGKGQLIVLEYRLGDSPSRTRMFLLPANTSVRMVPCHEG